jgi:Fur family transcriptional regulator, ferric uptake regulator
MTTTHSARFLAVEDVDEAVAILREHGLRVSAARRVVLEALFAADGPVSAEHVAAGIVGRVPRSDLASVYRNLETLEELGLVRHVHLGHGPGLYALAGPAREYLVCESCDTVQAVDESELDDVREKIEDAFGFEARFSHFPIVGLCRTCSAEADADDENDQGGRG